MILEAGDAAATTAHALSALSELCQVYWRPVYIFLRKQGYGREDAQELTRGFFAHLLENRGYSNAPPDKGRIRSFFPVALKHFAAYTRHREDASTPGGGTGLANWDYKAEAQIAR